jgi:hypothetical protein
MFNEEEEDVLSWKKLVSDPMVMFLDNKICLN